MKSLYYNDKSFTDGSIPLMASELNEREEPTLTVPELVIVNGASARGKEVHQPKVLNLSL